jgi:hypothetical protein
LNPAYRPNCDALLKLPAVQRKLGNQSDILSEVLSNNELISTIKMPKNIKFLKDVLPKSCYGE